MIYESLIAPSESPTSIREIKRSLLTYDNVNLIDPDDRDVIPSNTFVSAIMGMPFLSFDMGQIRPMGKMKNYDNEFQKVYEECKPAVEEGLIRIISTYERAETNNSFTIGSIPTGGYPLNVQFVYWLYRNMAQNEEFLKAAIMKDKAFIESQVYHQHSLSLEGHGDGGINDIPALPLLDFKDLNPEVNKFLTQVARARIASFIKYAGFCEQKNLVPIFPSSVYGYIAERTLNNTQVVLSEIKDDIYWINRNKVLELCHEEYINDATIDALTIEQVLKLRTKIWGKQAKAREELFSSIAQISQDINDNAKFNDRAKIMISEYRKVASELERERKNLHFKIKCDIGIGILAGGPSFTGLLTQLQSPFASMGLTLAAGGIWALEKSKEYVPLLRELKSKEEELKRGAGFGLQNFYSRFKKYS